MKYFLKDSWKYMWTAGRQKKRYGFGKGKWLDLTVEIIGIAVRDAA